MRTFLALPLAAAVLLPFALALGCSSEPGQPGVHYGPVPTGTPTGTPTSTGNPATPPSPTGTTPTPMGPPTPVTTETWNDGKTISGNLVIMAGSTVTIAPGAKISAASGTTITVNGTLTASSQATHGSISGSGFGGVVVGSGGVLDLTGVDLAAGLTVKQGATSAKYDYGTITGGQFNVEAGAKLTTAHATVNAAGATSVGGELDASYLSYNTNGNEGMAVNGAAAVLSITDSVMFGTGPNSGDMISVSQAKNVSIAYSEIKNVHCDFHFNGVDDFTLDHLTLHDSSYGFMLYGSSAAGTKTVSYTNIFNQAAYGADEGSSSTTNGPITFSNGYWAHNGPNGGSTQYDLRKFTNAISVTGMSETQPVAGVGPR